MLHIPLYLHPLPTNFEGLMKPDFSDYIIAVLFELNDGLRIQWIGVSIESLINVVLSMRFHWWGII